MFDDDVRNKKYLRIYLERMEDGWMKKIKHFFLSS